LPGSNIGRNARCQNDHRGRLSRESCPSEKIGGVGQAHRTGVEVFTVREFVTQRIMEATIIDCHQKNRERIRRSARDRADDATLHQGAPEGLVYGAVRRGPRRRRGKSMAASSRRSIVHNYFSVVGRRVLPDRKKTNQEVRPRAPRSLEGHASPRNHGVGGTGFLPNPIPERD
jgi:hypothetical protein